MADNGINPMETGENFFSPSPSIHLDNQNQNDAIRRRAAGNNAFLHRINHGNGTGITAGSIITNIGFVRGGYRQVHFASDLPQSETGSIHDIDCPMDNGLLPFKPTDGFQTKVHRGEFDVNFNPFVDATKAKQYPPPSNVAYELAADAQSRYQGIYSEESQTKVANAGKVSEPGNGFDNFAVSTTRTTLNRQHTDALTNNPTEALVSTSSNVQYNDTSTSMTNDLAPITPTINPVGVGTATLSRLDSNPRMNHGYLPIVDSNINEPLRAFISEMSSESRIEGLESVLTPSSKDSLAGRIPPFDDVSSSPILIRHDQGSSEVTPEMQLFQRIHEWNQLNKAVLGADANLENNNLPGDEGSLLSPFLSRSSSLSGIDPLAHENDYSMAGVGTLEDNHSGPRENEPKSHFSVSSDEEDHDPDENEPKSHFSVSSDEDARSEDNGGSQSSKEVPVVCKVDDLDPAGIVAYMQDRIESFQVEEGSDQLDTGEGEIEQEPEPFIEQMPGYIAHYFSSKDASEGEIVEEPEPFIEQMPGYIAHYFSSKDASEGEIVEEPEPVHEQIPDPPNHHLSDQEAGSQALNEPDIFDGIMGSLLFADQQPEQMADDQANELLYCKVCGDEHIVQGSPRTLQERDTCGASLPEWFPSHEFLEPVRAWQRIINRWVTLEQIFNGYDHPDPRRSTWDKEFHEPSAIWEGLRSRGGWWTCRKDAQAPYAEQHCKLCHRKKSKEEEELLTPVNFMLLALEEKEAIEQFVADGTRMAGEEDKHLVMYRIFKEGSPLTWGK